MNTRTNSAGGTASSIGSRITSIAFPMMVFLPMAASSTADDDHHNACEKWASDAKKSCLKEAVSDYWLARAKCRNLSTEEERVQCTHEALSELHDATELCKEQNEARLELCEELGGGIYDPVIDPRDFVRMVDNPYFPLVPGTTFVYLEQGTGDTEHIVVTVTHETKEILGVTCTTVHDVVSVGGSVIEDTIDSFAQDVHGNVWYFGEVSQQFEDGELVTLDGSFRAGREGAKPGIIMEAAPRAGDLYRQEFFIREAEDVARVLSLSVPVTVPYGHFSHCLKTEDFTPIDPGAIENKFYAPGVGLVLEFDPETGVRTELIEVHTE